MFILCFGKAQEDGDGLRMLRGHSHIVPVAETE